ncbi:hypothetical protein B296_00007994 [Ensete ventricosum]|uniref:Uncharacterized protein n=1 Tax=Ensete ventricosum TaxID=4639 RepID=A0A427AIS7_ENSVE|nr:hypothetical protein B296_00007994 [Ensete ventricosum]
MPESVKTGLSFGSDEASTDMSSYEIRPRKKEPARTQCSNLFYWEIKDEAHPNYDLVLQRVRKLVARKEHIGVSVQLPAATTKAKTKSAINYICYRERKKRDRGRGCSHPEDVSDRVVLALDGEGGRIDDLGVPLI